MKLSEAILLGSTMAPQIRGGMKNTDPKAGPVGTCALGAALDAVGADYCEVAIASIWTWLRPSIAACPECGEKTMGINEPMNVPFTIAEHLNDRHHWTREHIAEWVATIEPKELVAATVPEPALDQEPVLVA